MKKIKIRDQVNNKKINATRKLMGRKGNKLKGTGW